MFDAIARNDDNQSLTHPVLALGAGSEPGGPSGSGLPAGAVIQSVVIDSAGEQCLPGSGVVPASGLGYVCDLAEFRRRRLREGEVHHQGRFDRL